MAQWLRQGTAVKFHVGPAVATGGLAVVTSLKASIVTALKVLKHAATAVVTATNGGLTHIADGVYYVSLTSTHTNTLGHVRVYVRASGTTKSLPFWKDGHVVPANVFDSLVSGSAKLNVGTLASGLAVWSVAARTLTSAGVAWTAGARTLTSAAVTWTAGTRTLTSAGVVWTAGTRSLTGKVTLISGTHTGAIIPSVSSVTKLVGTASVNLLKWRGSTPNVLTSGNVAADAKMVNASATGAANLAQSAQVIYVGSVTTSGGTTTTFRDSALGGDANYLNGRIAIFKTGNLAKQAAKIILYATGTKQVTVSGAFTRAPASGDVYVIV
jgi:hypothetical protein